jgi:6-phosphogluconolactonase
MKNKHFFLESNQLNFDNFAADFLFDKLNNNKLILNIALSGGDTPLPILNLLKNKNLIWERLNFYLVDERCVKIDHPQSNYGNLNKHFFKHITSESFPIVQPNISFVDGIDNYKRSIIKNVSRIKNGIPEFDLILLGMGDDGHMASLFPNTNGLKESKELVIFNKIPQLQSERITLTYPVLLNAKEIIVIVKGDSKKKIIKELYSNLSTDYPMQKIVDEFENLHWLID